MKNRKQIFSRVMAVVLLCALPSCTFIRYASSPQGDGSGGATSSFRYRHAENQYIEWCQNLPGYIIPRMCAYYELHPERFKPTGQGEEIEIAGFAAFIKSDSYFQSGTHCSVRGGTIYDPWGEPLHFVQDLNMDGYIEAEGERRIVMNLGSTGLNREHHFGICKQSPFKGGYGQPSERIFAATY
jgi:hypothetical protein